MPLTELKELNERATISPEGSLTIVPVSMTDPGSYKCEIINNEGETQHASAHLNVQCKSVKGRQCEFEPNTASHLTIPYTVKLTYVKMHVEIVGQWKIMRNNILYMRKQNLANYSHNQML